MFAGSTEKKKKKKKSFREREGWQERARAREVVSEKRKRNFALALSFLSFTTLSFVLRRVSFHTLAHRASSEREHARPLSPQAAAMASDDECPDGKKRLVRCRCRCCCTHRLAAAASLFSRVAE